MKSSTKFMEQRNKEVLLMCSLRLSRLAKNQSEPHFSVLSAEDTQKRRMFHTPIVSVYATPVRDGNKLEQLTKQKERNYLNVCIQATFCSGLHLDD